MTPKKYGIGDYAFLSITAPFVVMFVVVMFPFYLMGRVWALIPWFRRLMDKEGI